MPSRLNFKNFIASVLSSLHTLGSKNESIQIAYDGVSHHALGGGSYAYKENYVGHLARLISGGPSLHINVIIQPNSSPHFGTILNMALAFCLADRLRRQENLDPLVVIDLLDNAKSEEITEILEFLKTHFGVDFRVRMEGEFLSQERMPAVMRRIISQRSDLGQPRGPLVLTTTVVSWTNTEFVTTTECHRFQFNSQLFSLVFARFYEDSPTGYIQISGSDYAGFWQEQMIWRHLTKPIIIVYCPLILDWAGEEGRDLNVLLEEVALWVDEPFRLFRAYSVHYIHMLFDHKEKIRLGAMHLDKKVFGPVVQ
ncbi:hypothetical protein B0H13DRAFT_2240688 [Mycena leptocephala]|nr:hypothetical protein B0H13DRAFT_2240688 [Mycena leptocephala]